MNWCEGLGTVLANEEVAEWTEKGYTVERRPMRQWMMRITAYSERLLEDLPRRRDEVGVCDPRAVEAVGDLAVLVGLHLRERLRVELGIFARRDERRHPAHRVRAAAVAGNGTTLVNVASALAHLIQPWP